MFATSPYDAFFTSGLLSASRTHFPYPYTSSTSPTSPDVPISPRRGSLPDNYPLYSPTTDDYDYDHENTHANADNVFNFYDHEDADAEDDDSNSNMYFTLQPQRPSGHNENLRSFLSLDLAESQSMRSASLRRKPTTGSSSASTSARSNWTKSTMSRSLSKSTKAYSGLRFPQIIPELPSRLPQPPHSAPLASTSTPKPASPTPSAAQAQPTTTTTTTSTSKNNNLRLRFSRDSLRTIPSPKPAPCITLPEPPRKNSLSPSSSSPQRAGTPTVSFVASATSVGSAVAPVVQGPIATGTAKATGTTTSAPNAKGSATLPSASGSAQSSSNVFVNVPVITSAATIEPAANGNTMAPSSSSSALLASAIASSSVLLSSPSPALSPVLVSVQAKTPTPTPTAPRLPSLPPIPLELNIRMSALFASPPRPRASKPSSSRKSSSATPSTPSNNASNSIPPVPVLSLAKAPSTASSRFISPASRKPDTSKTTSKASGKTKTHNRESVATTRTATTTRTVSTRARRWNRSEALARLEGRSPVLDASSSPTPSPQTTAAGKVALRRISTTRNFMSMSDDESESDEEVGAHGDEASEMVFLRHVAEASDEDAEHEEDLDFDDGCSSSSSSSSGSSYVSLEGPFQELVAEGVRDSSSGSSGLSFPSSLSLRGLVGRMAGLNPFMEAEDVVLPVQTPPTTTSQQAAREGEGIAVLAEEVLSEGALDVDVESEDADADVDIDDNFRFPAPPRTTAAERRLSLALSASPSSCAQILGDLSSRSSVGLDVDVDLDTDSVFDSLFLEAPRSAPLPPPPPPYSPFSATSSFLPSTNFNTSPSSRHHASPSPNLSLKSKKNGFLAVPGSSSQYAHTSPTSRTSRTAPSSPLALPGLRRKRTKTRRGRDHTADEGLVSFIDFPELDLPSPPLTANPSITRRIGERSDSLPEEMRELRRTQRRARYDAAATEEGKTSSNRGSKDSKSSGSGSGSGGSKSNSWTWRSFIEVANV